MRIEFNKAVLPAELRSLAAFDRKVFGKADWFPPDVWKAYESFWMRLNGKRIGCCALQEHVDFQDDIHGNDVPGRGSLYIASTGILPEFRGMGFGQLLKNWEVSYARHHGFKRMVTNTRKSNSAMIALNRKFGFRVTRTTPRYYSDPMESTIVMELLLPSKRRDDL
jgi:ribosomal protein S18 acetylase RimI-like enzyme